MTRLFSAEQMRLRKSWIFWLILIVAALVSLQVFQEQRSMIAAEIQNGKPWPIDEAFFQFPIVNGILLSAFIPLFLGADFSDGTIRNKLIAGHSRGAIYCSYLLNAFTSSGILTVVTLTVNMVTGILEGGKMAMAGGQLILFFCSAFCCTFAFASLFVLISTQITNRAFASVACIGILLLMILLSSRLISELHIAFEARDVFILEDGKPVFSDPYPDPMYVSGAKRTLMEILADFLPTGQSIQISNLEAERVSRFPMFSALFVLLTSSIGLLAFSKKDIN